MKAKQTRLQESIVNLREAHADTFEILDKIATCDGGSLELSALYSALDVTQRAQVAAENELDSALDAYHP